MVQIPHPYMTTGKTIALTKQTFIHSSSVSFSSCQKSPKNVPKYLLKKFPCKWMNSRVSLMDFSSVAQSCPTLWDTMDCSTLGLPVHHQLLDLLKLMSTESVMPSNHLILSSPYPPAFNLSQHQDLFKWISSSLQVAKELEFQLRSPPNEYSGLFPLGLTGWIPLQSKGLSRVFSNTILQKHQFFSAPLSL